MLDSAGFCEGCLRTGDEIARWGAMSAVEQWALVARLEQRRKLRAAHTCGDPPKEQKDGYGGENQV
jgi:predicted Fe-S protein YdhL (DUF1289 family)